MLIVTLLICEVVKPDMDLLLEAFTVPPPSVLERVLKDLFYAGICGSLISYFLFQHDKIRSSIAVEWHECWTLSLHLIIKILFAAVIPSGDGFSFKTFGISVKGAPRDSLFGRFSLQALRFGTCNIRGMYLLI